MKEKKRSIFSNFLWTLRLYVQFNGKSFYIHNIQYILLMVFVPFLSMLFPSVAISMLQSKRKLVVILVSIVLYALLLKVLTV